MNQEIIGKFISECRKEKKLTQAQLAEILGVSDKSVSRWENGKTMPDLSLYEPLCQALEINVSELLYGKRMTVEERTKTGDQSALTVLVTKSKLETMAIFTEILIFVGIVITMTLTKVLARTTGQMILTMACGCFVWSFGLVLRIRVRKIIMALDGERADETL